MQFLKDDDYMCVRCGYTTPHAVCMRRHFQRLKPCKVSMCDVSVAEAMEGMFGKCDDKDKDRVWKCDACGKAFRTKYTLQYHKTAPLACKGVCSRQTKIHRETETHSSAAVHNNNNTTVHNNNNTTYTTINGNVTNNQTIVINAFGHENTQHITKTFLDQCVRRTNKGLVELIEKIHFDRDMEENCNIKATNIKLPLMRVHDGRSWAYGRKEKILDQLVDKGHGMMQEHFDDNEDTIRDSVSDSMFDHISRWMDRMQEKDKKTWEDVLIDMYILILNATEKRGMMV